MGPFLRAGDRGRRAYDGEARHEGQAAGEQPQRRATAEGPVAAAFVEEGPYPALERALTAHGDRGLEPAETRVRAIADQLSGVVGAPLARRDTQSSQADSHSTRRRWRANQASGWNQ